jgi:hypothetical protein
MNGSSIQPERAWQMALEQLRMDMSKASFDTWLRDTRFISFEDGIFIVGTSNEYGREWLSSRITSTVTRQLTGILDQQVEVQFVIVEEAIEEEIDDSLEEDSSLPTGGPDVLSLQAEYQSIYDEIVQPHQVIVVPGYFLRYIPVLGQELAWLYVGFRQAAYEAGAAKQPGKKFGAPAQKVAGYSGMSLRTFRRYSANPGTWQSLRGLVTPAEEKPRWQHGNDNHPHRIPRNYRVALSLPLTPFDELSLRVWLYKRLAEGKNPLDVLKDALEIPVDELIPWQENTPSSSNSGTELHSVQDVLQAVCGPISENNREQFQKLADQLAQHLMPPRDLVFLTHYFVTRWLPKLGHGQGWLVVLMRDRCYINPRTGEIRDETLVDQGYVRIANWLGLKRVKTIWEWLRNDEVARFVREISHEIGDWGESSRRFKVCLGEPMIEDDQIRANELLARKGFGAIDTISNKSADNSIGATDTHNGAIDTITGDTDTIRVKTVDDPIGAVDIHNGAIVTNSGANGTRIGGDDTYKVGANVTFDWRDWHSLNSLTPGFKHLKNSQTTPANGEGSELENVGTVSQKMVVAGEWKIGDLLSNNRISSKSQEQLLEKRITAKVFISWLLYAASKGGSGIRDQVGHAVSRLAQDPTKGAGRAYDRLAGLPANELADLIIREISGQIPGKTDWRTVMEGAPRTRLRALADQLGIPAPDTNYW